MDFSEVFQPWFWVALLQIILLDIVLSADNAIVIALASRALPQKQQKSVMLIGSAGAIVLRVMLTVFAATLLRYPYLKMIGAPLLLWIGVGLLTSGDDHEVQSHDKLWSAVKTILVADVVMSLDNVLAVAAAAKGDLILLVVGLALSIPLIVMGSQIILKLMMRFPVVVTFGAGLLGYIAGEMFVSDVAIKPWIAQQAAWLYTAAPIFGALLVVGIGKFLERREAAKAAEGG